MKYTKAMMDVVELEVEDVVLTSTCASDQTCSDDGLPPCRAEL